jgi:hypothetical protein
MKLSQAFAIITFAPGFYCLSDTQSFGNLASPSPNLPSMLITFFITYFIIKTFEENESDYLLISFVISFYLVTVKLAAVPYFAELMFILLLLFIFRDFLKKKNVLIADKLTLSKCIFTVIILFVIAIPYLIKGIIASGYPAFPSAFGYLSLKWSVPPETAESTADWIKSWSRQYGVIPEKVLSNWNWLGPWFKNSITSFHFVNYINMAIIAVIFFMATLFTGKKKDLPVTLFILCLSSAGCLFWFFSAPDPRFGYGYIYSFVGILLSFGIINFTVKEVFSPLLSKGLLIAFILLLAFKSSIKFDELINTKKVPEALLTGKMTDENVLIYVPEKGDQCFDGPLLSTPLFNKNLKIIFENNKPRMFWLEKSR